MIINDWMCPAMTGICMIMLTHFWVDGLIMEILAYAYMKNLRYVDKVKSPSC